MSFTKEIITLNGYSFSYDSKHILENTDDYFILNGKMYNTDYFQKVLEYSTDNDQIKRYISEKDETVLKIVERIPTFDSSDRMYDSYKLIYIIGNNGIYLHGGYCLVDAIIFKGIKAADEKTKQMLDGLMSAPANV